MGQRIDFKAINAAALGNPGYLQRLLPKARQIGRELTAGNLSGEPGRSFCLSLNSDAWIDNATGQKGASRSPGQRPPTYIWDAPGYRKAIRQKITIKDGKPCLFNLAAVSEYFE
jgi:hypothetical protein